MKKIVLLLALLLSFGFTLFSCQTPSYEDNQAQLPEPEPEPRNADELWERIDKVMSDETSSRVDGTINMKFLYQGVEVNAESQILLITMLPDESENFYYYSSDETKVNIGDSENNTKSLLVYENGKTYMRESSDGYTSRICSSMTWEEFYQFCLDEASNLKISPNEAQEKSMSKSEEKKWSLTYSNFETAYLEEIIDNLKLDSFLDDMELEISDVLINVNTDEKYKLDEMSIDIIAESYNEPVISFKMIYSDYNTAQKAEFDKTEYTEVDDVRVSKWIENYFYEAVDEETAKLTYRLEHKVGGANNLRSIYVENNKISYGNRFGKFTYNIHYEINGQNVNITYYNGIQSISSGGKTQKVEQDDKEAQNFLRSIINFSQYAQSLVLDITKIDENTYKLTLIPADISACMKIMESLDDVYSDSVTYMEIVMEGKRITAIETRTEIQGFAHTYVIEGDLKTEE